MAKLKGLGRGLDALLGGDTQPAKPADSPSVVDIDALRPGKYQPRMLLDQGALDELAASIKAQGVIQPIVVRGNAERGYEIIAGERRWRAARLAGLRTVPVALREVSDTDALVMALVENIQREDLSPLEQAGGIQRLISEFNITHDKAAEMVGRSRSAVSNLLRLLALAEPVRELMQKGSLDMGHARALLALPLARQLEAAETIVGRNLSVRETERLVARWVKNNGIERPRPRVDRDVARLEEELSQNLGTTVSIKPTGKTAAGRLTIRYRNLDQLDEILARLRRAK